MVKSKLLCARHNPRTPARTSAEIGVIFTNGLSVSLHVKSVITSCAQTLNALRVLRAHGLCESALQTVFRAVMVAN